MKLASRPRTDIWAGLLIALFGALGVWFSLDMRLGSAISMGPGYFPLLVFSCIVVLGLLIAGKGVRGSNVEFGRPLWRPIIIISLALLAFWAFIDTLGFVVASTALMLIAIKAQDKLKWPQALVFTAITVALASLLFVQALGLPFPLWPTFD
jgi:putative tricarboxylic transport membrane protein